MTEHTVRKFAVSRSVRSSLGLKSTWLIFSGISMVSFYPRSKVLGACYPGVKMNITTQY